MSLTSLTNGETIKVEVGFRQDVFAGWLHNELLRWAFGVHGEEIVATRPPRYIPRLQIDDNVYAFELLLCTDPEAVIVYAFDKTDRIVVVAVTYDGCVYQVGDRIVLVTSDDNEPDIGELTQLPRSEQLTLLGL